MNHKQENRARTLIESLQSQNGALLAERDKLREALESLCDKIEEAGWHRSETADARAALNPSEKT